jgi:hypothetical protein
MNSKEIQGVMKAWQVVMEKKTLDPVNKKALDKDFDDREDKDIDNDGDVDSSDEYLHNRRKTIKKAMKKGEVELDELSKKTLGSYIQKAVDTGSKRSVANLASKGAHKLATSDDDDDGEKEDRKAFKRSKGIATAAKKLTRENLIVPSRSHLSNGDSVNVFLVNTL